jgi:hypothetical protein
MASWSVSGIGFLANQTREVSNNNPIFVCAFYWTNRPSLTFCLLHFRKTHAMVGHSLALFLIDSLLNALEELKHQLQLEDASVETLLSRLLREEAELYNDQIAKIDFQEHAQKLYSWEDGSTDDGAGKINLDPSVFFSGKAMCHTARLPAQTRYLGYLTNTEKVGGPTPFGKETVSSTDSSP